MALKKGVLALKKRSVSPKRKSVSPKKNGALALKKGLLALKECWVAKKGWLERGALSAAERQDVRTDTTELATLLEVSLEECWL